MNKDKNQYLLDEVLFVNLDVGMTDKYTDFIKVLEGSDDLSLQFMATKIGKLSF